MKKVLLVLALATVVGSCATHQKERNLASAYKLERNEVAIIMRDGNPFCIKPGEEKDIKNEEGGIVIQLIDDVSCTNFEKPFPEMPKAR